MKNTLPPLYHRLFPREILGFEIFETKATCDSCAMAADKAKGKVTYQPDLKCCTFEPYLPNYLVGALLESSSTGPDAKRTFKNKISKRKFSLPIGMTASVKYQVAFNHRKPQDFGNRRDWLCPYYSKKHNNCGVWKYRGAVCTTFYCKSDFGKRGLKFWANLNDYLTYVEMALMEEVLVHLDFSPRQISDCLEFLNRKEGSRVELKSGVLPLARARKLWNGYFDEQEAFFGKTYQMVKEFDKKQFDEALGEMGFDLQKKLIKSLREIT